MKGDYDREFLGAVLRIAEALENIAARLEDVRVELKHKRHDQRRNDDVQG